MCGRKEERGEDTNEKKEKQMLLQKEYGPVRLSPSVIGCRAVGGLWGGDGEERGANQKTSPTAQEPMGVGRSEPSMGVCYI